MGQHQSFNEDFASPQIVSEFVPQSYHKLLQNGTIVAQFAHPVLVAYIAYIFTFYRLNFQVIRGEQDLIDQYQLECDQQWPSPPNIANSIYFSANFANLLPLMTSKIFWLAE